MVITNRYHLGLRAWAEWIAWELNQAGYTTGLKVWDSRPGENLYQGTKGGVEEAVCILVVLSPDYLTAIGTHRHWAAALARKGTVREEFFLPVRVRKCTVKGWGRPAGYVDLVGAAESAARKRLLAGALRVRPPESTGYSPVRDSLLAGTAERPPFPGALPPVWNVPWRPNPFFTGRDSLLADLRETLTGGKSAALTQARPGLGGLGKTQLAVEYAHRHASDYSVVWWIHAEEPVALGAEYAQLAVALDLPAKHDPHQRVAVNAVRQWLEENSGWLLIFDNIQRAEFLHGFLPDTPKGHVLISSPDPAWDGVGVALTVPPLERADAVELLLKRSGKGDEPSADALAQVLEDLPLAVHQAGACIRETQVTIADYLAAVRSLRKALLDRLGPSARYGNERLSAVCATSLAMAAVPIESGPAVDLLHLCAYLASCDITPSLLREGNQYLAQTLAEAVAEPSTLDQAIAALRRYALAEVTGEALSVHPLVQAVTRDRLDGEARRLWARTAVRLLNGTFPYEDKYERTWVKCARLAPHAFAAVRHVESLKAPVEEAGLLLNQVGLYLRECGEFTQARSCYEHALSLGRATYGPVHPTVMVRLNNLGIVLKDLGSLVEARACFERALAIGDALYGPEHFELAVCIHNLCAVVDALGDLDAARLYYTRALPIYETAAGGAEDPIVAGCLNNLGKTLSAQGDLAEARGYLERALAIEVAVSGGDHPRVAVYAGNLATVLHKMGDLEKAETYFKQSLAIDEAFYGGRHRRVASDLGSLAAVYRDQGELGKARACLEQVVAIHEAAEKPHPESLTKALKSLCRILVNQKDWKGARAHLGRIVAVEEAQYGKDHPSVAHDLVSLGRVLKTQGDLPAAKACFARAQGIFEAAEGPRHPLVARVLNELGQVMEAGADLESARACFERALAIDVASSGRNHPRVARDFNSIGCLLKKTGDMREALGYLSRSLQIYRDTLGDDHPRTGEVRENLESLPG